MGEEETTMLPIIDLQENEGSNGKLREACKKWGCFRVVNHGISTELMAEIKSVAAELFDRPVEIKQRNKHEQSEGSGYVGLTQSNRVYEALSHDIPSSLSFSSFCSYLHATPHQREILELYTRNVQKLANDITSRMAKSMGLDDDDEDDSVKVQPAFLTINKYNVTQEIIGSNAFGSSDFGTHTDPSLITILLDDERLGGLEIMDPSGKLIAVDPFPGSFLINLGDIAVPWSNGRMRNLQHRVLCKDVGIRMSLATVITLAGDEDIIKAHHKFLEGDNPPKYAPFSYAEYRKLRASKKMHAGEVLELLRSKN